jgi:hypothetical protein
VPSDGSQDGSGGGEYENANAAAKHAHASHRFRISHSLHAYKTQKAFREVDTLSFAPNQQISTIKMLSVSECNAASAYGAIGVSAPKAYTCLRNE